MHVVAIKIGTLRLWYWLLMSAGGDARGRIRAPLSDVRDEFERTIGPITRLTRRPGIVPHRVAAHDIEVLRRSWDELGLDGRQRAAGERDEGRTHP
jgi:hypothetical protein